MDTYNKHSVNNVYYIMIQYTHTPEIKVLLNIFYYARSALIQSILLFSSTLDHEKTKQMQSDHDPQNWFHHHW